MILAPTNRPRRVYVKDLRPATDNGTVLENYAGMDIADVNLPALAEEIYLLLKEELRLEHEQHGWR